jgi:hypothetical protein
VHFFTAPLDGFTFLSETLLSKPEFIALRRCGNIVSPILAIGTFMGLNSTPPCVGPRIVSANKSYQSAQLYRNASSICRNTSVSFFVNLCVNHCCCVIQTSVCDQSKAPAIALLEDADRWARLGMCRIAAA